MTKGIEGDLLGLDVESNTEKYGERLHVFLFMAEWLA